MKQGLFLFSIVLLSCNSLIAGGKNDTFKDVKERLASQKKIAGFHFPREATVNTIRGKYTPSETVLSRAEKRKLSRSTSSSEVSPVKVAVFATIS